MILLELCKESLNTAAKTIYAEMPSDQFKDLGLKTGDRVSLFIKHAHWFNLSKPNVPEAATEYYV